jgi:hypothetical protein
LNLLLKHYDINSGKVSTPHSVPTIVAVIRKRGASGHPLFYPIADLLHHAWSEGRGFLDRLGEEVADTRDDFQEHILIAALPQRFSGGLEILVWIHHLVHPCKKKIGGTGEAAKSRERIVSKKGAQKGRV